MSQETCEIQSKGSCNINSKGKALRLVGGAIVGLIGVTLVTAILLQALASPAWWAVAIITLASGLFMMYEGWSGWCVLRAMGWRTPI